jgi:outer membrane lipoprotein-sorting protein
MQTFSRVPALRWAVPLLVAALLLGVGWTTGRVAAWAQGGLPPQTAAQLLEAVQRAHLDGLSGTVVERSDLGLPAVPGAGGDGSSDLGSLISGTHTLRVWASRPDKARVALLGTFGESDLVLNGRQLWTWSSRDRIATHRVLPAAPPGRASGGLPEATGTPVTPQQAAHAALRALDPTTRVSTTGTAVVAGRRAYELVLTPRNPATLVGDVRIAVDGQTHVPLRVQVFARRSASPAFEVGFTRFDPTRPDAATFRFTPPPGATVRESRAPSVSGDAHALPMPVPMPGPASAGTPAVVGQGWGAVVVGKLPAGALTGRSGSQNPLSQVVARLPRVSGSWGSGRLMAGTLFSVLLTDDGRVAAGAVPPRELYHAVAAR